MIYACLAWEFPVDSHLLKLQRLQNTVLRTTGNLQKHTPTRALHRTSRFRTSMVT
jgi:hypothetical protein